MLGFCTVFHHYSIWVSDKMNNDGKAENLSVCDTVSPLLGGEGISNNLSGGLCTWVALLCHRVWEFVLHRCHS